MRIPHRAPTRILFRVVSLFALSFPASLAAQETPKAPNPLNNLALNQIYNEDQRVRSSKPLTVEERLQITRTDADRLRLVKEMVTKGELQTTADYRHAAFVVQHSLVSSDYLLAHSLAVVCATDGDKTCAWLSAATLDRYLQSIQHPQIYGTQFIGRTGMPVTQAPYDTNIVSDSIRKRLGVPLTSEQEKQLEDMNHGVKRP